MRIHSSKMNINTGFTLASPLVHCVNTHARCAESVNFEELARSCEDFNGAQLKAVCVEAGMIALRREATELTHEDFMSGIAEVSIRQARFKFSLTHVLLLCRCKRRKKSTCSTTRENAVCSARFVRSMPIFVRDFVRLCVFLRHFCSTLLQGTILLMAAALRVCAEFKVAGGSDFSPVAQGTRTVVASSAEVRKEDE